MSQATMATDTSSHPTSSSSSSAERKPVVGLAASLLSLLPGASQGASQVLLGHPLDTVKTRVQTAPIGEHQQHRVFPVMRKIIKDEGARSLYRGVTPPLLLTASKRSLQFALWEKLNVYLHSKGFWSGAIAGFLGTVVGCPMHVIKVQTQICKGAECPNAWQCFLQIVRREGVRGLYRGMYAQIMKDTAFASCYLGIYGSGRAWAMSVDSSKHFVLWGSSHAESHSVEVYVDYQCLRTFLVGCVASLATWTLLQPLDTFKTFIQSKRTPKEFFSSVSQSAEGGGGWRLMWRGLPAALIRAGPVSGCAMIVYESSRSLLHSFDIDAH